MLFPKFNNRGPECEERETLKFFFHTGNRPHGTVTHITPPSPLTKMSCEVGSPPSDLVSSEVEPQSENLSDDKIGCKERQRPQISVFCVFPENPGPLTGWSLTSVPRTESISSQAPGVTVGHMEEIGHFQARRRWSGGSAGKESTCSAGHLGWEDPLEKEMATHSSMLAWKIPWTEEPGRLQSMGSQRVGHD